MCIRTCSACEQNKVHGPHTYGLCVDCYVEAEQTAIDLLADDIDEANAELNSEDVSVYDDSGYTVPYFGPVY